MNSTYLRIIAFPHKGHTYRAYITRDHAHEPWLIEDITYQTTERCDNSIYQAPDILDDREEIDLLEIEDTFKTHFMPV